MKLLRKIGSEEISQNNINWNGWGEKKNSRVITVGENATEEN